MYRQLYKVINAFSTEEKGEGFLLEYYLLENLEEFDGKSIKIYGIELRKESEVCVIADISSDKKWVEELLEIVIRNMVTPVTLKDVVQDIIEDGIVLEKKTA